MENQEDLPFYSIICFGKVDFYGHVAHFAFLGIQIMHYFVIDDSAVANIPVRNECSLARVDDLYKLGTKAPY